MAYETSISLPSLTVKHKDIVIAVKDEEGRIGRLKISKGGAVWVPGNAHKGFRMSWRKIDEVFQQRGRKGEYPI